MSAADDDDIIEASDDDQRDVLPADVLQKLQQAWIDERMAPELLVFEGDVVDCMLDQVEQMEANLKRVSKSDFKVSIHKMEVERIRYMITSYLRCRITKIEQYNRFLLDSDTMKARMSPEEVTFAVEYRRALERHLADAALRHLPTSSGAGDSTLSGSSTDGFDERLTATESTVAPNLDTHVFLRVDQDSASVLIADETGENRSEEIDLTSGSLYLLRYEPIAKLLSKGRVHLV